MSDDYDRWKRVYEASLAGVDLLAWTEAELAEAGRDTVLERTRGDNRIVEQSNRADRAESALATIRAKLATRIAEMRASVESHLMIARDRDNPWTVRDEHNTQARTEEAIALALAAILADDPVSEPTP